MAFLSVTYSVVQRFCNAENLWLHERILSFVLNMYWKL
jgi:hypothetical protein